MTTIDDRKEEVKQNNENLRDEKNNISKSQNRARLYALICFIVSFLLFNWRAHIPPNPSYIDDPLISLGRSGLLGFGLLGAVYGVIYIFIAVTQTTSIREIQSRINENNNELDLLAMDESNRTQKAEKLFKAHQFQLDKYYDQTLRHGKWIFFVGLACLFIGIGIIVLTLYLVTNDHIMIKVTDKVITAVLGTVVGILTNFVAAIYLKMFTGALASLGNFHNKLVKTHYLHFGNLLISQIEDEDTREETIKALALEVAKSIDIEHLEGKSSAPK